MADEQSDIVDPNGPADEDDLDLLMDVTAEKVGEWLEAVGDEWLLVTPETCQERPPPKYTNGVYDQWGRFHQNWRPIQNRETAGSDEVHESWKGYVQDVVWENDDPIVKEKTASWSGSDSLKIWGQEVRVWDDDRDEKRWEYEKSKAGHRHRREGGDRYQVLSTYADGNLWVHLYDVEEEEVCRSANLDVWAYQPRINDDQTLATKDVAHRSALSIELD